MRYAILLALLLCLPVRGGAWQVVGEGSTGITYEAYSAGWLAESMGKTVTIPAPANVSAGDTLVAVFCTNTATISLSGWDSVDSTGNLIALKKVATGSEPADYTFNVSSSGRDTHGVIVRIAGSVSSVVSSDESGRAGWGTTTDFSTQTVGSDGSIIIWYGGIPLANNDRYLVSINNGTIIYSGYSKTNAASFWVAIETDAATGTHTNAGTINSAYNGMIGSGIVITP